MELMGEVQSLKKLSIEKDKRIKLLENRVSNLEQYSRMNILIISGLKTRHRSYARVASREDGSAGREAEPSESEAESLEQQVVGFLGSRGISPWIGPTSKPVIPCLLEPREKHQG